MKISNVSKNLVVSFTTFDGMINALMLLNQLMNAGMAQFSNPIMNTRLGSRRSLTFFHRHLWITVFTFMLACLKGQLKFPGKKDFHFIVVAGSLNMFLNMQLNSKNNSFFTLPFMMLFQPLFPAFVLMYLIGLGLDKWTPRKIAGCVFCILPALSYVTLYNITDENRFFKNFFLIIQIMYPAMGAISLRFAVLKGNLGIFNIAFWASLTATALAFSYYSFQYWLAPSPPFFSYTYQLGLMRIATIWIFRIIADTFNVCTFIYFTSKKKIAKAACFVTLNGMFIVLFNLLMGTYDTWIYAYLLFIYTGYSLIAYDRAKVSKAKLKKNIKIRYISHVDENHKEVKYSDFTFNSELNNHELMNTIKQVGKKMPIAELPSLEVSDSKDTVDFRENYFGQSTSGSRKNIKNKVISKTQ
ncbi:unnamed protein product [Moneuplotes crassus]|uniref:Uncharacterized protein n=1 Tax=Euplotes crassus TaxID=5936 RepID=A0AAD2DB43_EUPCR|nr:unnamed protein product [Moneuplotes crassus]